MAEVLPAPSTSEEQASFKPPSSLHRSSSQQALYLDTSAYGSKSQPVASHAYSGCRSGHEPSDSSSADDSPPESPELSRLSLSRTSSFHSTPPSSTSLDFQFAPGVVADEDDDDEDDLQRFMYGDTSYDLKATHVVPPGSPNDHSDFRFSSTEDDQEDESFEGSDAEVLMALPADDTQVRHEPSRQVDYLSHEWHEEDIWESWKHIVSKRRVYGERSRLENASWRTWAKQKNGLKTVSPETLNWLKDCDVTWLYGPLQEGKHKSRSDETPTCLSTSNSFLNKKPILKKRSVSEEMLQKSLSSSSLIKQAAAAVQAQRSFNSRNRHSNGARLRRSESDVMNVPLNSDFVSQAVSHGVSVQSSSDSSIHSPSQEGPRRHIRFDNKVEQCIAVDFKDFPVEDETSLDWMRDAAESDEDGDDELLTIKTKRRKRSLTSTPGSSRNSFSETNTGIAKLPSTTLKPQEDHLSGSNGMASSRRPMLVSSASQETIRPTSKTTANFMLADSSDDDDVDWEPSGAFGSLGATSHGGSDAERSLASAAADEGLAAKGMRRTPSGMFMPMDESEDEDAQASNGLIGRVVDTVNTARDIAYVLYNVGWRR